MDNDIIFLNGIKDLPMADGVLRVDRFVSVICYTGKLQVDINMTTHSICAGQVLICIQNDIIGNAMQSPDFDGAVLSLSPEIIINQFGESNIWDYFFHLADHPIINAHAENLEMLRIYYEAFSRKMRMGQTVFHLLHRQSGVLRVDGEHPSPSSPLLRQRTAPGQDPAQAVHGIAFRQCGKVPYCIVVCRTVMCHPQAPLYRMQAGERKNRIRVD